MAYFIPRVLSLPEDHADTPIILAALTSIWDDCRDINSSKSRSENDIVNPALYAQAVRAANELYPCDIDDYNLPSASLAKWIQDNYSRKLFIAHNLQGIKCKISTPGDPLLKHNQKGELIEEKQKARYVMVDPATGAYEEEKEETPLGVKTMYRSARLYLTGELLFACQVMGTGYFVRSNMERILTLIQKNGIDPPHKLKMDEGVLIRHVHDLFTRIMALLEKGEKDIGDNWTNALNFLEKTGALDRLFHLKEVHPLCFRFMIPPRWFSCLVGSWG